MTREERELLFKDLCSRLPYGVKVQFNYIITSPAILKGINKDLIECDVAVCELEDVKPYLFPLSSMTKEQKKYIRDNYTFGATHELFEWLNENHFDYRGLIEKGLAINATGLNIY